MDPFSAVSPGDAGVGLKASRRLAAGFLTVRVPLSLNRSRRLGGTRPKNQASPVELAIGETGRVGPCAAAWTHDRIGHAVVENHLAQSVGGRSGAESVELVDAA
jgi:hypothetical protein